MLLLPASVVGAVCESCGIFFFAARLFICWRSIKTKMESIVNQKRGVSLTRSASLFFCGKVTRRQITRFPQGNSSSSTAAQRTFTHEIIQFGCAHGNVYQLVLALSLSPELLTVSDGRVSSLASYQQADD